MTTESNGFVWNSTPSNNEICQVLCSSMQQPHAFGTDHIEWPSGLVFEFEIVSIQRPGPGNHQLLALKGERNKLLIGYIGEDEFGEEVVKMWMAFL